MTWTFAFADGTVETTRVTTDIVRTPDDSLQSVEMVIVVDDQEIVIIEESLDKQGAINVRKVPDGPNLVEDTTANNRNTVDITPTSGASDTIPAGTYVARNWETEWMYSTAYTVTIQFMFKGSQ